MRVNKIVASTVVVALVAAAFVLWPRQEKIRVTGMFSRPVARKLNPNVSA